MLCEKSRQQSVTVPEDIGSFNVRTGLRKIPAEMTKLKYKSYIWKCALQ